MTVFLDTEKDTQTMTNKTAVQKKASENNLLDNLANKANLDPQIFKQTLMATVMPSKTVVTDEQFTAFLMVANKYNLDPMTKEIYAFPSKKGGIQPIVSIDGWIKLINTNPNYNGIEYIDHKNQNDELTAITCKIHRKDHDYATEITEYLSECSRSNETWKQWPARMLRHKATIQAARYAFGFSGILDLDEAQRAQAVDEHQDANIYDASEYKTVQKPLYPESKFKENQTAWRESFTKGKTAESLILAINSKYQLSADQEKAILELETTKELNA